MRSRDWRMVVIPRSSRCVKVLSSMGAVSWGGKLTLCWVDGSWMLSSDASDLNELDCDIELPEETRLMRLFPEATRFILPNEVDRFMLESSPAKSWVDLKTCCSTQCFCMMRPSSIENCAEISNNRAETTRRPGRCIRLTSSEARTLLMEASGDEWWIRQDAEKIKTT